MHLIPLLINRDKDDAALGPRLFLLDKKELGYDAEGFTELGQIISNNLSHQYHIYTFDDFISHKSEPPWGGFHGQ